MTLVTSRLEDDAPNFLSRICTLATKLGKSQPHWLSTHHTVGREGTEGYYEHATCTLCGQGVHTFVEAEELTQEQMRERAAEHRRTVEAIAFMLDNVEPDYAAGRGTKDGRIIDRTEPWLVPLEDRHPDDGQN